MSEALRFLEVRVHEKMHADCTYVQRTGWATAVLGRGQKREAPLECGAHGVEGIFVRATDYVKRNVAESSVYLSLSLSLSLLRK